MNISERKLEILIKEWEIVEGDIHETNQSRFKIRSWALTINSGLFALSVYQQDKTILIVAAVVAFVFWMLDAKHQNLHNLAYRREDQIEEILENPTDENLLHSQSPKFGRSFNEHQPITNTIRNLFDPLLLAIYGSIYLVIAVAALIT